MNWKQGLVPGMLLLVAAMFLLGNTPGGYVYRIQDLPWRSVSDYYSQGVNTTTATISFTSESKGLTIVNEGSQQARVSLDATAATTTRGILLGVVGNTTATYQVDDFVTKSISVKGLSATTTTINVEVRH